MQSRREEVRIRDNHIVAEKGVDVSNREEEITG
jgi:hypothetical protein